MVGMKKKSLEGTKVILQMLALLLVIASLESCDELSPGLILNETKDIIEIELVADASKNFDASGNNMTFDGYCNYDYSKLSNLYIEWNEPILKSRFSLEPNSSFRLGGTLGLFSVEDVHYDTLRIKTVVDSFEYLGKEQIFDAFKREERKMFYLRIE